MGSMDHGVAELNVAASVQQICESATVESLAGQVQGAAPQKTNGSVEAELEHVAVLGYN